MNWASQIKAHAASKQPKRRKPPLVVHSTWAQTRPPSEETGDPGAVIDVHYTVDEGAVRLTDAKGVPIGNNNNAYVLQPGEGATRIAKLLALGARERAPVFVAVDGSWVV